ncbi:MAG: hypothetical protein PHV93_02245 [Candidatus Pacebacteria bacterium]|nr:hypothetical protein [Candidatus Paceibacterota bacterium]
MTDRSVVYVTCDFEAAGLDTRLHSPLSIGACVVSEEKLAFREYFDRDLVFYEEMKPVSMAYEMNAMRIGCSELKCLATARGFVRSMRAVDDRLDPSHQRFDPLYVLEFMKNSCQDREVVRDRLISRLESLRQDRQILWLTDKEFDQVHLSELLGQYQNSPLFKWASQRTMSRFRKYALGRYEMLGVRDCRLHPHKADEDAVFLATIAQPVIFGKNG